MVFDVGSGEEHALWQQRNSVVRYGIAAFSVLTAFSLRAAIAPWLGQEAAFAFLLPATFLSAWFGGVRGGLFAIILGSSIGVLEFESATSFRESGATTQLVLFVLNGAMVTAVCALLRRLADRNRTAGDEAARNFEIMANSAPVLIWVSDASSRCAFVNQNWVTFTGRTLAQGRRPGQIHPADQARYQAVAAEAKAAKRDFRIEYRLRRSDDTYRWLDEHAVPRFGRNGSFEGYIGSCSDVTDARNEREELAFIARVQTALAESLDMDRCADVLVQSFVPRFADWCSIQLVSDAGQLEEIRVHHFEQSRPAPARGQGGPLRLTPQDPLATAVIEAGGLHRVQGTGAALISAVARDEAHAQRLRGLAQLCYVGAPLRVRGHIIGVLALATAESGRTLGEDEERVLHKIAGIAGFALDNARLYRSTRHALAAEEHALREMERSERRFRFFWEANLFGLCTISRTGRILTANKALTDLLGYTAPDIASGQACLYERTAVGSRAADQRANDELQHTGRCTPFEKEFVRPDGTTVQVLTCGSLLPNSDECIAFVLDLTARKHAERALDRQRMLLNTIIEAIPAAVGYLGTDGRFLLHNERFQAWLEAGSDDINGRLLSDVLGSAAHDRVAPYIKSAFRGRNMRHEIALHDGQRDRHLIATYRPDRDADGRVCGLVIHAYDITERKETEQALADALTRYRFLADAMPQMVWTALPDGQFDYVNRRWLETTGMTELQALSPDGWLRAVHEDDRAALRVAWHEAVAAHSPFEHECRLSCGHEADWRWHLVRALPRRDDHLAVVQWVGSATDIDEQRRAYAELAEARERLKSHAEELEAHVRARTATLRETNAELEAFTYSVSHDLRTPLQFIRGFAEALRSDAADSLSSENRDLLSRIIRAATRMDTIIQDLLAYSRLSRADIQLVEVPLDDAVADVLANHGALIKQTGAWVEVDRPLPVVLADKTGLYQALSNLVSNALKFSRPGEPPAIAIRATETDCGTRLWVEDHGIGIDPRHHERIFQLFERLHSQAEYPGTGIGLSLVRKAAQRMGAQCGVQSEPGAGSRFWIEFPHACPVTPPGRTPGRPLPASQTA